MMAIVILGPTKSDAMSQSVEHVQDNLTPDRIFDRLLGEHQCNSQRIDFATGESVITQFKWIWKRDMNGKAIRDWNVGLDSLNLRIYDRENEVWRVWYFTGGNRYSANMWTGGAVGDQIILTIEEVPYGDRIITNQLEFSNISETGFEWLSRNIDTKSGEEFVDWRIDCFKVSNKPSR